MMKFLSGIVLCSVLIFLTACKSESKKEESVKEESMAKEEVASVYMEPYRPQYHFSPQEKWMNDPNGLVYHKGVYHLFYQYYPNDIVWGPMHWGHATSKDMIHWEHKPIALYPDEHGYIFSGSALVDTENTSGLGTKENPALVAIFTYHNKDAEDAGRNDYETQGIAYSLDNGETWTKYAGNPVIKNDGMKDFRDPKVFWNAKTKQWTMMLVAGDHLQIWLSKDLLQWEKASVFGKKQGAHGGVWECPDLFPLQVEGTDITKWVLLISVNPGAPNGGSGTQYFIGDFDGTTFTSTQKETRWLDWGTDNYAGVTYNNTPNKDRIFIGWMSNWNYATKTPTLRWRSAMTVPRKLNLKKFGDQIHLVNYPIAAVDTLVKKTASKNITVGAGQTQELNTETLNQTEVTFSTDAKDFVLFFKNDANEELVVTISKNYKAVLIDRIVSGKTNFQEDFANTIHQMPIADLPDTAFNVRILMDQSSMELFINDGQYVMTEQIFPSKPYTSLVIENTGQKVLEFKDLSVSPVEKVW